MLKSFEQKFIIIYQVMCPICRELGTVQSVHVCRCLHVESSHLPHLSIFFSHLMQEAEQPLGAGVYDTPTFSKPLLMTQVMDMPTYSEIFQAKVTHFRPSSQYDTGVSVVLRALL